MPDKKIRIREYLILKWAYQGSISELAQVQQGYNISLLLYLNVNIITNIKDEKSN
jgi:hypothetical protein